VILLIFFVTNQNRYDMEFKQLYFTNVYVFFKDIYLKYILMEGYNNIV